MVLIKRVLPSGAVRWQARYKDPDSGAMRKPLLDPTGLPTEEARRAWAIKLSRKIKGREMDLAAGAPRSTAKPLESAIEDYRRAAGHRLRPKTLETYDLAVARLATWGERNGVRTTADLTRPQLAAFRDYLIAAPKRVAVAKGKRGQRKDATRKRSKVSVNRELRSIKTVLNEWRSAGLLPNLDRDAITDVLKALPVKREEAQYLAPSQVSALVHAALRHDQAAFKATREEHAGLLSKGTTKRHNPIAPFVAFLLLSGCRRGEALALRWSDVDLDALDSQGNVVGEIRLPADITKTHHARKIGLEVSPALRRLLAAMKLQAGRDPRYVFGGAEPYTIDLVVSARARLMREYGAPDFDWQVLRSTCATYLTNAPGIWGNATVFLSAKQLGHSVAIAERHYLGVHRGIPREARTLEEAMQIDDVATKVTRISGAPTLVAGAGRGSITGS